MNNEPQNLRDVYYQLYDQWLDATDQNKKNDLREDIEMLGKFLNINEEPV